MFRQPRSVLAVAFASVIAFMGIGLVDPILNSIARDLNATPSQVSLLFTSYLAVTGVAMIGTGAVSSRLGAKRTLLIGLAIIVFGAAMAGFSDSIGAIIAWRAVWGLGNALFIATALATIVKSARGSTAQAIILYEAALGLGIAVGPLVGGALGEIVWRAPFFGVAVLMLIAAVATYLLVPATPADARPTSILEPLRALQHAPLLITGLTALLYNFGFFTLLAFTPFVLAMPAMKVGLVFFGWGLMLALSSVFLAPRLQRRFGTLVPIAGALGFFALLLAVIALFTDAHAVVIAAVVLAGAASGLNNTLITETVMKAAPVERGVASAAYSFVRFAGGAVAPWVATRLGEVNVSLPFWVGAGAVAIASALILSGRRVLAHVEEELDEGSGDAEEFASELTVADA